MSKTRVKVEGHRTHGTLGAKPFAITLWSWWCPDCGCGDALAPTSWRDAFDEAFDHARWH